MTDFYQLPPAVQAERYRDLAELVLPEWGLQGAALEIIKMRENAVFKVETAGAAKLALRIHRAAYHSDAALRSELQWMQALAAAGIETPEVIPTLQGELFVAPDSGLAGLRRQIDVFAWVEGEQLGSVEAGLDGDQATRWQHLETIGALAARVHNQAINWRQPAGFERHAWDLDGLVGEAPFWGRFWELQTLSKSQAQLMRRTRDVLRRELQAYGRSAQTYSLIHADMIGENVLVDGQHVRLIDFDDAGFGWHLFEIATSLYFNHREADFEQLCDRYIAGYRSQRPLADAELEQLPMFMLARATTYLGWVHTRSETETAQEMAPILIDMAVTLADNYLSAQAGK